MGRYFSSDSCMLSAHACYRNCMGPYVPSDYVWLLVAGTSRALVLPPGRAFMKGWIGFPATLLARQVLSDLIFYSLSVVYFAWLAFSLTLFCMGILNWYLKFSFLVILLFWCSTCGYRCAGVRQEINLFACWLDNCGIQGLILSCFMWDWNIVVTILFCPFFILYGNYDVAEVAFKALLWLDF